MNVSDDLFAEVFDERAAIMEYDGRDYYITAEQALLDMSCNECPPELTDEVRANIIESDTLIHLQFYPDTPIGSYLIVHHDIDAALDAALECLK